MRCRRELARWVSAASARKSRGRSLALVGSQERKWKVPTRARETGAGIAQIRSGWHKIAVEGEKTASAEEIKLAFDYYPVIDGQSEDAISHSNGNGSRPSSLTDKDSEKNPGVDSPMFVKYESKD